MEDRTEKRFYELADRAWNRGIVCCTDFLDGAAQAVLHRIRTELPPVPLILFGGAEGCERKMAGFGAETPEDLPIACLRVTPVSAAFSEDLQHRDVLGALMSLGFERELLGDIVLRGREAYVFCVGRIAPYIAEQLTEIRHTAVRVQTAPQLPEGELFRTERLVIQVASQRLDALAAHAFHMSRGNAQTLFPAGRVFLDGAVCTAPDVCPQTGQIVSVRGFGRFRYLGASGRSKKGKWNTVIEMYV